MSDWLCRRQREKTATMPQGLTAPAFSLGIFHQKIGIFEDAFENRVSFNGSANETFSAWDVESNGKRP